MKRCIIYLAIFYAVLLISPVSGAPHKETGRPFITTYPASETDGDLQTWDVAQDSRGVLYFGSSPGVLEFDGATWRMIENNNKTMVRSLDIDKQGHVYVGAITDFGYLTPDSVGQLRYKSLLGYVDEEDRNFSYVWTTIVTEEGIYFQSRERIFRLEPEGDKWRIKVWKPVRQFGYAFWLDGVYYVQQIGIGMMKMVNDSLEMLPGGGQFANDRLQVMLPFSYDKDKRISEYLLGTFERGLFIYDGHRFRPFTTDVDASLYSSSVYDGVVLADNMFGLATLSGGFFIIDKQGHLLQTINQASGLTSNAVECVFVDRKGNIWLGPENSICHIEVLSPLSVFDKSAGLTSAPADLERHHGLLYVATSDGIFYLNDKISRFEPVSGITGVPQSFDLLSVGDELLAAVNAGLYRIRGTKATLLKKSFGLSFAPLALHRSRLNPNRVIVGMYDGLSAFRFDKGKWIDEGRIEGVSEYITSIVEPEPGLLWLGAYSRGTLRVRYNEKSLRNPSVERFGPVNGLPEGGVTVYNTSRGQHFCTNWGLYAFDERSQFFQPDTFFRDVPLGRLPLLFLGVHEDYQGNLWVNLGRETVQFSLQSDGSYIEDRTAFLRFSDLPVGRILTEKDGIVWFGRSLDLIRYDPAVYKNYQTEYTALIRKVLVGEGSVLYGGALPFQGMKEQKVSYSKNGFQFDFAAPSFDNPREIQFQSILEGFDDQWSPWSKEKKRTYTNLPPGDYRFVVRAKNIYGNISHEANYDLTVLPPWYRSWWAYMVYIFMFGISIASIDRVQRRRLIRRERERSQLREAELRAQTAEAQTQVLQAENERKKNIELLSEIGKEITASLSVEGIIDTVYEHINSLMDASAFGIGIYNEELKRLEMPATKEKGKTLPLYFYELDDENRPAIWCYVNQKEIFLNDYMHEYGKYIKQLPAAAAGDNPESMIYLPVTYKKKKIGVITAQSFKKNAYSEYHLNILRNLATYAAIALDNADTYRQLNILLDDLKSTQQQMITQEKLASLGALTAGIAHEIKNPLNFVNNFAELTMELVGELRETIDNQKSKMDQDELKNLNEILEDLDQNAKKINEHGKRADSIIKSMLQHSRGKKGELQETDINIMLEEDINLAYHGLRAQDASFNVTIEKEFDTHLDKLTVVPQDISRVFLNIISNGFYEVHKKKAELNGNYSPVIRVESKNQKDTVEVRIRDNGNGIPDEVKEKLFNPFFTTKPTGMGTGLGLSISYDIIVQEHHGDIRFETREGEFTEFIITLPKNGSREKLSAKNV